MNSKNDVDWARVARWAVAVAIEMTGVSFRADVTDAGAVVMLLVAVVAFWLLKLRARQEQERRIEAAELRAGIGR